MFISFINNQRNALSVLIYEWTKLEQSMNNLYNKEKRILIGLLMGAGISQSLSLTSMGLLGGAFNAHILYCCRDVSWTNNRQKWLVQRTVANHSSDAQPVDCRNISLCRVLTAGLEVSCCALPSALLYRHSSVVTCSTIERKPVIAFILNLEFINKASLDIIVLKIARFKVKLSSFVECKWFPWFAVFRNLRT